MVDKFLLSCGLLACCGWRTRTLRCRLEENGQEGVPPPHLDIQWTAFRSLTIWGIAVRYTC